MDVIGVMEGATLGSLGLEEGRDVESESSKITPESQSLELQGADLDLVFSTAHVKEQRSIMTTMAMKTAFFIM